MMRLLGTRGLLAALAFLIADSRAMVVGHDGKNTIPDLTLLRPDPARDIYNRNLQQAWKSAQHHHDAPYKPRHFQSSPVSHQRLAPPARPPKKAGLPRKSGAFY